MYKRQLVESAGDDAIVHCLTGTPLTNRPRDLFPLLQLVRHPLGRSFLSFAKRYCDAYRNDYGWVADGASNIEELTVELHGELFDVAGSVSHPAVVVAVCVAVAFGKR